MSRLELLCYLYLESLSGIEDIKEQFPLPIRDTQLIAASLRIRHPEVNGIKDARKLARKAMAAYPEETKLEKLEEYAENLRNRGHTDQTGE